MPVEEKHLTKDLGPYGCRNRPHPNDAEPRLVQDGWFDVFDHDDQVWTRAPNMVLRKTEWKPIVCGHTGRFEDPRCAGCKWRLFKNDGE